MFTPTIHFKQLLSRLAVGALCLGLVPAGAPAILAQETKPTTPKDSDQQRVVMVLGDSLAAGYGVERSEAFPALLENRARQKGWNVKVVNAGVSGDTTAGGRGRIDWLLNQRVDVLIIELGGNDGLRGIEPAATRANLQAIIDTAKARKPGIKIVVSGMQMPPNLGPDYRSAFEATFPEVAAENDALLIPHLLENVGGFPELNQPDRIHPTPEGHRVIADNVWEVLEPLLRELVETAG